MDKTIAVASWLCEQFPIAWVSISAESKLEINTEVAFQVGALRPKDKDSSTWVCGLVRQLHLSANRPYAEVAMQGDGPCSFDLFHTESIETRLLVPSVNFLLKSGPKFQYFGNPRGIETFSFMWADRVVDSTGSFACLQSKDTIRWTSLDFLILGFTKLAGEMCVILLLEPHTKDTKEKNNDLFERVCCSTVNYFASNFPVKRSGSSKLTRGLCPYVSLPPDTQAKITPVFNHLTSLAYVWAKQNAKFKSFSSLSKLKTVPKVAVADSERIDAHQRVFGSLMDEDEDSDVELTTSKVAKTRSKTVEGQSTQASTPKQVKRTPKETTTATKPPTSTQTKRKPTISPSKSGKKSKLSSKEKQTEEFDDLDADSSDEPSHPMAKSPKHVVSSSQMATSTSPRFKDVVQSNRTASLEQELKTLRQQHLDTLQKDNDQLRNQLRTAEVEVTKLRTQLESAQSESEKIKGRARTITNDLETCQSKLYETEESLQLVQSQLKDTENELANCKKLVNDLRGQRVNMEEIKNMVRASVELGFETRQSVVVEELTKFRTTTIEDLTKLRSEMNSIATHISVSFGAYNLVLISP